MTNSITRKCGLSLLLSRGAYKMEVGVHEVLNQKAVYRNNIPKNEEELKLLECCPILIFPSKCSNLT
jgi:hypothetical protein